MAEALRRRRLAGRITTAALVLSIGAVLVALIGALGSGQGAWHFRTGFTLLQYALFAAALGAVLAIAGLIAARGGAMHKYTKRNILALVVGLGFVLYLGSQIATARSVPAIHDVTTDIDDIPKFYRLVVRRDNMENIPDLGRRDLAALPPRERWRAIHREHYDDLRTIRVPWTVPQTIERAEALARERGWEIVTADPRSGILEAVDTSTFFRFKDNVLVRARPAAPGGTDVDMRSISRVGASDVGVNAKRVRSFMRDLQQSEG